MTNDLNEREDQIIALKKREAALEEHLKMKERMQAQDAQLRLQLGKRLEQVLMDKEEIKDELDSLKVELSCDLTVHALICCVGSLRCYSKWFPKCIESVNS